MDTVYNANQRPAAAVTPIDGVYDELPHDHRTKIILCDKPPTGNNQPRCPSQQFGNNSQPTLSRLRSCQNGNQPRNIYSSMRINSSKANARVLPAYNYSLKSRSTMMLGGGYDATGIVPITSHDDNSAYKPALSSNIKGPLLTTRKPTTTTTAVMPLSTTPVISSPVIVSPLRQNEAYFNYNRTLSSFQQPPASGTEKLRRRGLTASSTSLFSASPMIEPKHNFCDTTTRQVLESKNSDFSTYAVPSSLTLQSGRAQQNTVAKEQNRESGFIDMRSSSSSSSACSSRLSSASSSAYSSSTSNKANSVLPTYRFNNNKLLSGRNGAETEQIYDQLPASVSSSATSRNHGYMDSGQHRKDFSKPLAVGQPAASTDVIQEIHNQLDQLLLTMDSPIPKPESHLKQISTTCLSTELSPPQTLTLATDSMEKDRRVLDEMLQLVSPHILTLDAAGTNSSITSQAAVTRLRDLVRETTRNASTLSHQWLNFQRDVLTKKLDCGADLQKPDASTMSIRTLCRDLCETLHAVSHFVLDFALSRVALVSFNENDNSRRMTVAFRLAALVHQIHTDCVEFRNQIKLLSALNWDFAHSDQAVNKAEQLVQHARALVADERLTELQGFIAGNAELIFSDAEKSEMSSWSTIRRPLPAKPCNTINLSNKSAHEQLGTSYSGSGDSGDEEQRFGRQSPSYDYVDYSLMDNAQTVESALPNNSFSDKMILFPTGSSNMVKSSSKALSKMSSDDEEKQQQRRFRADAHSTTDNVTYIQLPSRRRSLTITRKIRRAVSFSKSKDGECLQQQQLSSHNAEPVTLQQCAQQQCANQRLPLRWASELRRKAVNLMK